MMFENKNIYYVGNNKMYHNFYTVQTIEECYNYFKDKKVIAIDIETTYKFNGIYNEEGLNPHLSNIVMFQIGDGIRDYVIDYREIDISILHPILESPNILKVGHNLKFEYVHILHNEGIRLNNVYDTMVVEQILYNGFHLKNGLKDLNERYLGITVDKSTRNEFAYIKERPFTLKQINYGAEDVRHPLMIRQKQLEQIIEKDVENTVQLEMLFLLVLGDIEYKGMYFDQSIWEETYNKNLEQYKVYENILNEYVLNKHFDSQFVNKQLSLFNADDFSCNIQWTSSKQVIEFFRYLDICPQEISKSTSKMSYTVNAKVLLASLNTINLDAIDEYKQLIKDYLRFKELEQSITTFGIEFFKYVNPVTNRLHSNYRQILNTGRISSSGPNLQNIPSDLDFRRAFSCPQGYKIVNADYSGQENICLANTSLDPDILRFYEEGLDDMHSYNAQKIFPELANLSLEDIKKYHPDKRQIAKSVSFALAYGGNGFTIANNLGISLKRGEEIYQSYFNAFPKLKLFFDKTIRESMQRGYIIIDDITNRKFYFKDFQMLKSYKENNLWKEYYTTKGKYERACLNYIIQGAAGSITKFAAVLFRKWILDNNYQDKVFITNLVHDEINVECIEELSQSVAENLEIAMKKSGQKWCKIVPLNADAKIVDYWSH